MRTEGPLEKTIQLIKHFVVKATVSVPDSFNPIRTVGVFLCFWRFFANTFGNNEVTHSKLVDFSQNVALNRVKATNFQNQHEK